jgi:hypothetical protein
VYLYGVTEAIEQIEDVKLPPCGKVLALIVIAYTRAKIAPVLVRVSGISAFEVGADPVPRDAGAAV